MVEKIEIVISPKVIDYLDQLIYKLYEENYFSYLENAEQNVSNIFDAIPTAITYQRHRETPSSLLALGQNYITYQSSKKTTWYIFSTKKNHKVLDRHITNNHTEEAKILK